MAAMPMALPCAAPRKRLVVGLGTKDADVFHEDLEWVERPAAAAPLERPDKNVILTVRGKDVVLPLTFMAMLVLVRELHLLHGSRGLEQERSTLQRAARLIGKSKVGPAQQDPELYQLAIRLAVQAMDAFGVHLGQVRHRVRRAAVRVARERLAAARAEIAVETWRYFGDESEIGSLQDWLADSNSGVAPPDFADRTASLRESVDALRSAKAGLLAARRQRFVADMGSDPMDKFRSSEQRMFERDAERAAAGAVASARAQLLDENMERCRRHPIVLKLVRSAPADTNDVAELTAAIRQVLADTFDAGIALDDELVSDPDQVWEYPVVVESALARHGYSPESTAGIVARERLGAEGAFESVVHLATTVTGAMSMASAMVPPAAVAAFVADLIASLADALLVYVEYYQQKMAFDAALSPELSIAAEPSLAWACLLIGLDLLAAVPSTAPVR